MMTLDLAYVALGSNLGDRDKHLADARARIASIPNVQIVGESTIEQTDAIGPGDQSPYLNQMIAVETELNPRELLTRLHEIEIAGGRERKIRWGARTIDLDIVSYVHTTWDEPDLKVPHTELPNRDFWIRELAELKNSYE